MENRHAHQFDVIEMATVGREGCAKRQPLTGKFHDKEHLGAYAGYGPKTVGAICDPSAFAERRVTYILRIRPGWAATPIPQTPWPLSP